MTDVEHAGAGINLILILIFNWIYERVAFWLTDKELRWVRVNLHERTYLHRRQGYIHLVLYCSFSSPRDDAKIVYTEKYGTI
jgi:hypothetical protein